MLTIAKALIVYSLGICQADVVCEQGQCIAYPTEQCETLDLAQCLDSAVYIDGSRFETLGCAPDATELDL